MISQGRWQILMPLRTIDLFPHFWRTMNLILYSKPGCHLCEGLEEKIRAIESINVSLDIRDITQDDRAFEKYQYEIPVLYVQQDDGNLVKVPRSSPRSSISQIEKMLQSYL